MKEDESSSERLETFVIDVIKQTMEEKDALKVDLKNLRSTARTHKYFVLIFKDRVNLLLSTDIKQSTILKNVEKIDLSLRDDLVIYRD
jgi:hypothetical protein